MTTDKLDPRTPDHESPAVEAAIRRTGLWDEWAKLQADHVAHATDASEASRQMAASMLETNRAFVMAEALRRLASQLAEGE